MAACIKQGSLHVLVSGAWKTKKWQKKFYVLRGFTDTATARLECHVSEADFQSDKRAENTYSFDEIADIRYREAPGASPEHKHTCEIGCKRKVIVFSAPSSGEMQEWVMAMMALKFESDQRKNQPTADVPRQNVIYEPLGVASRLTVPVKVDPTDASRRCRLGEDEYLLHVCRAELILMDPTSKEMKQQWLYRYIRTYTNTSDVFSFECGRRCSSGEGVFSFTTPTAAELAVEVQAAVDALQSSDPSGESKYTSMKKQATTSAQEKTTDTATTTTARPSLSPRVSYVNVPVVNETTTGPQTSPDTDGQTTQRRTRDSDDAKATTTTRAPPVRYENVAVTANPQDGTADAKATTTTMVPPVIHDNNISVSPNPQDANGHTMAGEQVTTTGLQGVKTPAAQQVYENVVTTSSEQSSEEQGFLVGVEETEVSERCKLAAAEYRLHLDIDGINLEDATSKAVLLHWPYNVVRRFGCGEDLFLLEVGRRAISGEGLFKFKTTTPGILETALLKCRNFQRTNSSASSVVVRPSQRSRPGEQQRATTAIDPRRGSEYEAPLTGSVRPQSTTYTSLERPSKDTRGNAKYVERVAEPAGQRGEAH